MATQEICRVIGNGEVGAGLFALTMEAPVLCLQAQPGQFVHITCGEGNLLRRPISICNVEGDKMTLVFQVKGAGTKWLAGRRAGDLLDVLGTLGHGFRMQELGARPIFVGGGIGVPPLLITMRAAREMGAQPAAILGFRSRPAVILEDAFRTVGETYVCTDDGSYGQHGFVTDVLKTQIAGATAHAARGGPDRRGTGCALPGVHGGAHGLRHRRMPGLCLRAQAQGRARRRAVWPCLQGWPGI